MTGIERLWNGWRSSYVSSLGDASPAQPGSIFTQILESEVSDDEAYIIHRAERVFVLLNVYPYGTGHCLVIPYREVADLEDLDADERAELWATTTDAVTAVKTAYHPDGVNVGVNLGRAAGGSVAEHLHVHVVPRWTGDGNFMTAIANARTLPEPLIETADKLRTAWPGPPTASSESPAGGE